MGIAWLVMRVMRKAVADLVWRHRRPLALAVVILALAGGCHLWLAHERAVWTARGERQAEARQFAARDTAAMHAYAAAAAHTDTIRDTVTRWLSRWRTDTLWRRETVTVPGDAVPRVLVPLPVVARTDSLVRACQDLVTSCAAERVKARAALAVKDSELAVLRAWKPPAPAAPPSHTTRHVLTGAALGIVAGYFLHRVR